MVVYNDSTVVVGQILGYNMAKEDRIAAFLVKTQVGALKFFSLNSKRTFSWIEGHAILSEDA